MKLREIMTGQVVRIRPEEPVGVAARMLAQGESCSGGELAPNYLRLSQAERERLEREKTQAEVARPQTAQ